MQLAGLREQLCSHGARAAHADYVLRRWVQALPQDSERRPIAHWLPLALRRALPGLRADLDRLARLKSRHPAADGSARLLVALSDGRAVESVLLPNGGLCVSTQVGCAVGCVFCMSGRTGLARQLGSAEIVAQVALARSMQPVSKVVFMGMGEPSHNLDNVLAAIAFLGTDGGIARQKLVFSTVGDERVFSALQGNAVRPALAISLHSTQPDLRARLLPRAPSIEIPRLVCAAETYARATRYPIQYQWTLLAGINDTDAELAGIVHLLRGKYAIMNLIPYNEVPGLPYCRPSAERILTLTRSLHAEGIVASVRQSAGQEVKGGCGQLWARAA